MQTMPYNTRRKSVSLTRLGIHIPQSHGPRASSHRSPPATAATATTSSSSSSSSSPSKSSTTMAAPPSPDDQPPAKKVKRSNSNGANPRSPSSAARTSPPSSSTVKNTFLPPGGRIAETTPPPSPGDATGSGSFKVDTQGIHDEIVVGVIEQLERTGNRPHLLKELAAVLQHTIPIVQTSANQPAIISSRLTNYMKRTWTALAPCPLAKELVGTHPKRIYFFLTTQPRQSFPEPLDTVSLPRIISPSLTSNENEEEEEEHCDRRRSEMSPSPEIDLATHYFEDEDSPMSQPNAFPSLHHHHHHHSAHSSQSGLSQRRTSPPLEGDEREFTQTASSLQQRKYSHAAETTVEISVVEAPADEVMITVDESDDAAHRRCKADAAALFGTFDTRLAAATNFPLTSSPMMRPVERHHPEYRMMATVTTTAAESSFVWTELKRTETVELDELDDLFESY